MDNPQGARPLVLRNYQASDWEPLYDVCVRTGDRGQDASATFSDPSLVPDIFAGPYLYFEPDLAFVLDDGQRPVGYVIGTADTAAFVEDYKASWLPRAAPRHPEPSGPPFANRDQLFAHLLHWPERMLVPGLLSDYPAHLHIDLLPPVQGQGWGRRLVEAFAAVARHAGAPGLHVGVDIVNDKAHGFYRRLGFCPVDVAGVGEDVVYYGLRL